MGLWRRVRRGEGFAGGEVCREGFSEGSCLQGLTLVALWLVGQRLGFAWPWYLGLAGMAAGFVHQQWRIRYRERWPCFHAFLSNHWAGGCVFVGLYLQYLIAGGV